MSRNNGWIKYELVKPLHSGEYLTYSALGCTVTYWSKSEQKWYVATSTKSAEPTWWQPLPFAPGEGL